MVLAGCGINWIDQGNRFFKITCWHPFQKGDASLNLVPVPTEQQTFVYCETESLVKISVIKFDRIIFRIH